MCSRTSFKHQKCAYQRHQTSKASLPKATGLKASPHPAHVLLGLHQALPWVKNGHCLSSMALLSSFEAFGSEQMASGCHKSSSVCSYSSCTEDKGFKLLHSCVSFLSNSSAFNKKTKPTKKTQKPLIKSCSARVYFSYLEIFTKQPWSLVCSVEQRNLITFMPRSILVNYDKLQRPTVTMFCDFAGVRKHWTGWGKNWNSNSKYFIE